MKKIIYIISNIDKANEFEWVAERIDTTMFSIEFISINAVEETTHKKFCNRLNIPFYHVPYKGKKNILSALFNVFRILRKQNPDAVHAHLFEGGLIGITAAFLARIKNRIYTRHYATQHHEYAPSGVKYDKLINLLSTCVVATSKNVQNVLINMENCPVKKVFLIHHGFPLEDFTDVSEQRIEAIRKKYNFYNKPVVGVISRYLHLKGIQYIIPAFKQFIEKNPTAHLVLANAKGEYKGEIRKLLSTLPQNSYTEIEFEYDNAALFHTFDIFIHVPINPKIEAFGQIYIESLASGVPSIFTLSGVATEFIKDKENAIVVDFENTEQIFDALNSIFYNHLLQQSLIKNGLNSVKLFSIENKVTQLEKIYSI